MIGDKLLLKPYHLPPAQDIFILIKSQLINNTGRYAITIAGESGSGKSTLAIALNQVLEENGYETLIIHMDDYFLLPPTSNHNQRLEDINHVGPQEVDLALLQTHINEIVSGADELYKPLIHYKENERKIEYIDLSDTKVVIIEGTYVSLLDEIDTRVFIDRTYIDTYRSRVERNRDPITPFIEDVLQIEHAIIKKHKEKADIIVNEDYQVTRALKN